MSTECSICHVEFASMQDLHDHNLAEHTTVETNNFVCPTCDKGFASKTALNGHLRVHAASKSVQEDSRIWKCSQCEKTFGNQWKLYGHLRHHKRMIYKPSSSNTVESNTDESESNSDESE